MTTCFHRDVLSSIVLLIGLWALVAVASGQTGPPKQDAVRPTPPTRDPNTPGYVTAKELPDGAVPPANVDGNFIIGPTHEPPPEMTANGVPKGTVIEFTMNSSDSKIYPGIARDANTFGTPDPADPAKARRDHQPSGSVHAEGGRLCSQAVRARHRRAFHRRRRRAGPAALFRPSTL